MFMVSDLVRQNMRTFGALENGRLETPGTFRGPHKSESKPQVCYAATKVGHMDSQGDTCEQDAEARPNLEVLNVKFINKTTDPNKHGSLSKMTECGWNCPQRWTVKKRGKGSLEERKRGPPAGTL